MGKVTAEMLFSGNTLVSPEEFSLEVETRVASTGERILEVLMDLCEHYEIEPELMARSLTTSLKEKLQEECERFNLLTTNTAKLPL